MNDSPEKIKTTVLTSVSQYHASLYSVDNWKSGLKNTYALSESMFFYFDYRFWKGLLALVYVVLICIGVYFIGIGVNSHRLEEPVPVVIGALILGILIAVAYMAYQCILLTISNSRTQDEWDAFQNWSDVRPELEKQECFTQLVYDLERFLSAPTSRQIVNPLDEKNESYRSCCLFINVHAD